MPLYAFACDRCGSFDASSAPVADAAAAAPLPGLWGDLLPARYTPPGLCADGAATCAARSIARSAVRTSRRSSATRRAARCRTATATERPVRTGVCRGGRRDRWTRWHDPALHAGTRGRLRRGHRDPEGEPQQVRAGPRAARDQARSLPVLLDGLPDRLWLLARHPRPRRRPARRDGLRPRADVPGLPILVKPIALFRMEDDQGIDDKVLGVPLKDPGWNSLERLDDISKQLRTRSPTSSRSTRTSSRSRCGRRLVLAGGGAGGDSALPRARAAPQARPVARRLTSRRAVGPVDSRHSVSRNTWRKLPFARVVVAACHGRPRSVPCRRARAERTSGRGSAGGRPSPGTGSGRRRRSRRHAGRR